MHTLLNIYIHCTYTYKMEEKNSTEVLTPEDAEAAAASVNAYISEMPKHKQKIRKLLIMAFHPTTVEGERLSAFAQAFKLMQRDKISFLEIMRADWGGGPLVAAIAKVGHMTMTAGRYEGKNLAWIVQEDPQYIAQTVHNGWRPGPLFDAIKLMHNAWLSELVCRFTGDWDDPTITQWESGGDRS